MKVTTQEQLDRMSASHVRARLETEAGEHVQDVMVARFTTLPDVLVWGERHFKRHIQMSDYAYSYRECFAVAVIWEVAI